MPKFTIKDTFACWVTWSYEIEAPTAEEALAKYQEEQPTSTLPPEIGDTLDGYDRGTAVEWSGEPDPENPDLYWIDDKTGERVHSVTGERTKI